MSSISYSCSHWNKLPSLQNKLIQMQKQGKIIIKHSVDFIQSQTFQNNHFSTSYTNTMKWI